jgi:hypothetical protein
VDAELASQKELAQTDRRWPPKYLAGPMGWLQAMTLRRKYPSPLMADRFPADFYFAADGRPTNFVSRRYENDRDSEPLVDSGYALRLGWLSGLRSFVLGENMR